MHRSLGLSGSLSPNTLSGLRSGVYDGKIAGLYDLEETLGRGHFAVVKLARHVFTGEKVAVKVIDKSKLDEVSKAHLFQEVRCMKLVQHPNVVRLYEVIDTATKLYLILELGDGGDLYDYIMRHESGLSEKLAQDYFRQIVKAISYCHKLHVVHRDLKPENVVFFEKQGIVKLTDFGFSNKFCPGQKLETSCGSLAYSAPEILLGDSYDAPAVDVWSLGVILYMLVCGQAPFQEANDSETLTMIMDCKYNVPAHISDECKDLISRMLVRAPEKRASLAEIAAHPWLAADKEESQIDIFPLISREQLSEDDHNLIVQKIVNGNIATKEQIQESLDKNDYNHITATYFLLAERKLRSKGHEHAKTRRPEHLSVPQASPIPTLDLNSAGPNPYLLSVPRTPGDVPQRSRKCSIVQEDEEEEDIPVAGREDLSTAHTSLNRRGSRSEGRLNLAVQEKLSGECDRRKQIQKADPPKDAPVLRRIENNKLKSADEPSQWKGGKSVTSIPETKVVASPTRKNRANSEVVTVTTIITDSSTVPTPIVTNSATSPPKYRTMPPPTRMQPAPTPPHLNEIFEEGDSVPAQTRHFVSRGQNRSAYEQRRSKFHKHRTASCSSSDASDDDSENRKKRAHKLSSNSPKPLPGRRDSHDDSSDSQEPGAGAATGGDNNGGSLGGARGVVANNGTRDEDSNKNGGNSNNNGNGGNGGRKNVGGTGRRHKTGRRRSGETRLRESQSLNRITEVQEDPGHAAIIISSAVVVQSGGVSPKVKGFGARLLQGFTNARKCDKHLSRKESDVKNEDSEKKLMPEKKIRLLGKYFHVHKKLCIPLPGIFSRNRLYKAQSCGSLVRDRINLGSESVVRCRQRAVSVIRSGVNNSESDINQNMDEKSNGRNATVVQLNNVCNELTGICAIHLGQASKCCSFC